MLPTARAPRVITIPVAASQPSIDSKLMAGGLINNYQSTPAPVAAVGGSYFSIPEYFL